jgi:hypothetical protein
MTERQKMKDRETEIQKDRDKNRQKDSQRDKGKRQNDRKIEKLIKCKIIKRRNEKTRNPRQEF